MASKRPRSTESDEQVVQQGAPMVRRAESSSVKFNNYNHNPPVVVFAHGAGAPSTSEWMTRWRTLLANALNAVEVVTFDYPYISGRRKAAPDAEKLVGFHLEFVRKVAAKYPEHPLILIGKSLGSRVSCMVAAENDIGALAVVCLGYPLKAKNGAIRDEPLLKLTAPIMFVQGSNDNFCPLKLLEVVRKKLKSLNDLHVIEHGDHSFQIAKKNLELTGMTHEEAEERAAESIAMFVSRIKNEKGIAGPTIAYLRYAVGHGHGPFLLFWGGVWRLIMVVHLVSHLLQEQVLLHLFWVGAFWGLFLVGPTGFWWWFWAWVWSTGLWHWIEAISLA